MWWLLITKYRKHEVFFVSVPPMGYLLNLILPHKFSMVIWDVYPDVFKIAGMKDTHPIYKFWAFLNKKSFKKAFKIFTISTKMADLLKAYTDREVLVRPIWSIFQENNNIEKNKNIFITEHGLQNKFIVQYSGNIGVTHNVETLVEIAELIQDNTQIIFQIIGRGPRKSELENLVQKKNLSNCFFLPFQSDYMFPYSLSAADVGVVILDETTSKGSVPSKSYNLMSYGLENFVSSPPLGAIISLLMIFGLDFLGLAILRLLKFDLNNSENLWLRCQSPLIAVAVLLCITSPIVLAGFFKFGIPTIFGVTLVAIGLGYLGKLLWRFNLKSSLFFGHIKNFQMIDWSLVFIFFGYLLLALAPTTDADSLDYHIGTAIDILNTGGFSFNPEWFHSRLIGGGEILVALGLSVGSDQFSSLLQLLGLTCIVLIFFTKPGADLYERKWVALTAASTPVLLALVPAAKPLLLPCAMTTSAFMILNFHFDDELIKKGTKKIKSSYFLICMLAMTAATMKANFMLSGAIVVGLALFLNLRNKNWKLGLGLSFFMFLIILFPFLLWKYTYFNGVGILDFLTIFPGDWPGYANFKNMLVNYRGNEVVFPFSLFLPAGFGFLTVILGLGVFYFFAFLKAKNSLVVATLSLILGYTVLGQHDSRFFLEPYLWVLLAYNFRSVSFQPTYYLRSKIFRTAIAGQALGTFLMISFGVMTLFPGAISLDLRKSVMMKSAHGYDVMMWLDKVLPKDTVIISSHRSIGLFPRKTIAFDWYKFVENDQTGIETYLSLIALEQPEYFLLRSDKRLDGGKIPDFKFRLPCIGKVYAGPFAAKKRTRNPFRSKIDYHAWIRHVDIDCLSVQKNKLNGKSAIKQSTVYME